MAYKINQYFKSFIYLFIFKLIKNKLIKTLDGGWG